MNYFKVTIMYLLKEKDGQPQERDVFSYQSLFLSFVQNHPKANKLTQFFPYLKFYFISTQKKTIWNERKVDGSKQTLKNGASHKKEDILHYFGSEILPSEFRVRIGVSLINCHTIQ